MPLSLSCALLRWAQVVWCAAWCSPLPLWVWCGALPECVLFPRVGVLCGVPPVDVVWCGVPHTVGVVWSPASLAVWCGVVPRFPLWTWCGVISPSLLSGVVWCGVCCPQSPLWTWCGVLLPSSSPCGVVWCVVFAPPLWDWCGVRPPCGVVWCGGGVWCFPSFPPRGVVLSPTPKHLQCFAWLCFALKCLALPRLTLQCFTLYSYYIILKYMI